MILAQADGEAEADGEGGGEAGGSLPTTYALESQDPNAFDYDARPQIEAYVDLVRACPMPAPRPMPTVLETGRRTPFSPPPPRQRLPMRAKAWVTGAPAYLRTEAFRFYDGPIERSRTRSMHGR